MKYPNFNEEKKLWRKGFKKIIGLDEAGRGPLAGPVVAAAVSINFRLRRTSRRLAKLKLKDSKKLSSSKREEIFTFLTEHKDVKWGIGKVSEKVIDKINILEATKLAMKKAVKSLEKKLKKCVVPNSRDRGFFANSGFLILDGNFKIDIDIPQKSVIKGDEKVFSCAAASILAKVTRDRLMLKYHKKFPKYGFNKHKGYPTKFHFKTLKKYGPCKIHRKTFRPVSKYLR
jgi:ribonuclease HII